MMELGKSKIKIELIDKAATMPEYAHGSHEDAGCDIRVIEGKSLNPGECYAFRTGLKVELPPGIEMQLRSRSGMSIKGLVVANAPATIDPGYRGEVKVIIRNAGMFTLEVMPGDRVAQAVFANYVGAEFVDGTVNDTDRGESGLGSTGVK